VPSRRAPSAKVWLAPLREYVLCFPQDPLSGGIHCEYSSGRYYGDARRWSWAAGGTDRSASGTQRTYTGKIWKHRFFCVYV